MSHLHWDNLANTWVNDEEGRRGGWGGGEGEGEGEWRGEVGRSER